MICQCGNISNAAHNGVCRRCREARVRINAEKKRADRVQRIEAALADAKAIVCGKKVA